MKKNDTIKRSNINKTIAVILSILLLITFVPTNAFAYEGKAPESQESEIQKPPNLEEETEEEVVDGGSDSGDGAIGPDDGEGDSGGKGSQETGDNSLDEEDLLEMPDPSSVPPVPENDGVDVTTLSSPVTVNFDGFYTISSKLDKKKVIDVSAASTKNSANIQLYGNNNSPAQCFVIENMKNGFYRIKNVNSNRVLDVSGGSKKSGTNVQQYTWNGTDAQLWKLVSTGDNDNSYYFVSKLSNSLVLDISGASSANGANVQVYKANKTKAQKFYLNKKTGKTIANGTYTITSKLSSQRGLDISGASVSDGGNVQSYATNTTLAQKFVVSYDAKTGYYTIRNVNSIRMLDVAGARSSNGTNVQQYKSNGTFAQKWTIEKSSDGYYVIRSACSGRVLDISGGSTKSGANVQIYSSNGTSAQRWKFNTTQPVNNGIYQIKSALKTCLDTGGKEANNTNIQTYASKDDLRQKYYVKHISGGYYKIECTNSGRVLTLASGKGPNVVLYNDGGKDYQLWKPVPAGNGRFYWQNKATGLVLDVSGGSTSNGANVQTYQKNSTNAQKWSMQSTNVLPKTFMIFKSALNNNMVIDIESASAANGAKVQLYESNNTLAQKFQVVKETDGYRFVNIGSNKSLDVDASKYNSSTGQATLRQWTTSSSSASQLWTVKYVGGGYFSFYSKVGKGNSCLDATNGASSNGTVLQVYGSNGSNAQKFKPVATTGPSHTSLNITLDQMTDYQMKSNPYISVSRATIKKALDPTTYSVGQTSYNQFVDLRSYTGLSAGQLNSYIASTSSGRSGALYNQGAAFVSAAKTYGINESYLLSHAILESGWGTSQLARGNYYDGRKINGKTYPKGTYYNFFGWGAFDSNPLTSGINYAVINGWNTKEKAIAGAAKLISAEYIYRGSYPQPTLYAMKWDYAYSSANKAYGPHQYATGYSWPTSIAGLMGECYKSANTNPKLIYIVPKYK